MSAELDDSASPDRAALKRLVTEALERVEDEGSRVVDELCARHPQHAEALRRRLALLLGSGFGPTDPTGAFPERLGDFLLHEKLGQGGMGVVYRATQQSLGREVALKLIRPEQLYFPGARERFQREVEIAARLQHPCIAAVYAVGEQQGLPYFAMERVRGCSLSEALARLRDREPRELSGADLARAVADATAQALGSSRGRASAAIGETASASAAVGETATGSAADRSAASVATPATAPLFRGDWAETALRVTIEMCRALEHAHAQGVLHRDLKPSNCMLTPDGRVLLLDFGLAVQQGASELTRSGAALGSLPYMAPEQVDGRVREIDERTDVYGTGVTLYELLTLRQPFLEPVTELTRARILAGERRAPRALQPQLTRDAEVVCLTAMDADRARRYANAAALRRDLENALARRAIEARAASPLAAGLRWTRRHPAATTALALALLLVVGLPSLLLWQQSLRVAEAERALGELRAAEQASSVQRDRAEQNLERAVGAIGAILARIDMPNAGAVPELTPVRAAALEQALGFLQGFRALNTDSAPLELAAARVEARAGRLQSSLGSASEALRTLQAVLPRLEQHARAAHGDHELALELADTHLFLGSALADLGRLYEAEAEFDAALAGARSLLGVYPRSGPVRATIISACLRLVRQHAQMRRPEAARRAFEDALGEARAELALDPRDFERRALLAEVLAREVDIEPAGALPAHLAEALDLGRELHAERPRDARARLQYSTLLSLHGAHDEVEVALGLAELSEAIRLLATLVAEQPDNLRTLSQYANVQLSLGTRLSRAGRGDEAREPLERCIATFEDMCARSSGQIDQRILLAYAIDYLAFVEDARPEVALPLLRRAFDAARQARRIAPDRRDVHDQYVFAARRLSYCMHMRLHQSDAALQLAREVEQDLRGSGPGTLAAAGILADWIGTALAIGTIQRDEQSVYRSEALRLLEAAADLGGVDATALREDQMYRALVSLDGFEAAIARADADGPR
jgi:serine/threonine protein kinase